MLRKPWPIVILTIILLIIPISNILTTFILNSHKTNFSNFLYSLIYLPTNHMKLANLIIPSLLAAFAVWSVKKWSYIVLLVCVCWISLNGFINLYTYYGNLNFLQIFFAIISPIIFSVAITFYFLIPTVKTTYFDPKLRWWEAKPRYEVDILGHVGSEADTKEVQIQNISEGGLFFTSSHEFQLENTVKLKFNFNEEEFIIDSKLIFKRTDINGYGVQFDFSNTPEELNRIKRGILHLNYSGAKLCRPIPMWNEDLKNWVLSLLQGKGSLTPNIPQKYKTKN